VKLPRDLFAWLGIEPRFALDPALLDRRQRELVVERHAQGPRVLESINAAARLLRDPVVRAEQLFQLRGWPTKGPADPVLLERIFTDREFIDLARKKSDQAALQAWVEAAEPRRQVLIGQLALMLDGQGATTYPADPDHQAEGNAGRGLLLLEELRYFSRAVAAAHAALEAIED
jgi:hypothetical protein